MSLKNIDAKTLKEWVDADEVVVIDVREPAEHSTKKIDGTILLPVGRICTGDLPELGGKKLVVHCLKGGRGENACQKILSEQFEGEIYNLEGGIEAWEAAGLPVEKGCRKVLPLDRQMQLTVGLLIVLAAGLAHFVAPSFIFLAGFLGLGLTFAGLTGMCPLRSFIASMPWNQGG